MDEARFGLKVTHRRLWCPFGSRPPWTHDHQHHWFWLYAAVEPVSGTCVVLFLPHVDGVCFQRFLEELRQHTGSDTIGLVLDNSGSHTSGKVHWASRRSRCRPTAPNSTRRSAGSRRCAGSSPTRSSTPWKTSSRSYRSSPALLAEPRQASASDRLPMVVLCHGRLELHRLSIGRKVGLKLKTLMISYFRNSMSVLSTIGKTLLVLPLLFCAIAPAQAQLRG